MINILIIMLIAYLAGSLSSAIIVCKLMNLPDPRSEGSKNPGATNVLRLGGKVPALLTLVGDILKGTIPVLLALIFGIKGFMLSVVALSACLGHIYPIFFKFKGGKGVATALGTLLAMSPTTTFFALIVWGAVMAVTRYVSLASLAAALSAPILLIFFGRPAYLIPVLLISALIVWRHWDNIERLRNGRENRFKFKSIK